MAYRTTQSRAKRPAVLACVMVIHALLLSLLILTGEGPPSVAPRPSAAISVFSVNAAPAAPAPTPPPPPTVPSRITDTQQPPIEVLPSIETVAGSTSPAVGGCRTLDAISNSLLADPLAVAAVHASPAETRSVADAIVLWNVGWAAAAPQKGGPLSAVRNSIQAKMLSLDPSCLEEEVAGPRLIPFPAGERTTFIVIGSGTWRWRDLLSQVEGLASEDALSLESPPVTRSPTG